MIDVRRLNSDILKNYQNAGLTGSGIIFANIDSGVQPIGFMRGKVINGTSDGSIDVLGHGTSVASLQLNACPGAQVLSYRVFKESSNAEIKPIIAALEDILARAQVDAAHQYIVNMSLSGYGSLRDAEIQKYQQAIDALVAANIPVFVAAGNDGNNSVNLFPSAFQSPITVAAIDECGVHAGFSTWHNEVDFAELGVGVLCIHATTLKMIQVCSGTSYASPILSSKAALLECQYRKLFGKWMPEHLLYIALKEQAMDLGDGGRDPYFGYGFVSISTSYTFQDSQPVVPSPIVENPRPSFPHYAVYGGDTGVNIRNGASASFNKIGFLSKDEKCIVLQTKDDWSEIITYTASPSICGWCSNVWLKDLSTSPPLSYPTYGKYAGMTSANIRTGGGITYAKIGMISKGENCLLLSESNDWTQLIMHEQVPVVKGWVLSSFISK